jgi:hypothetical protein
MVVLLPWLSSYFGPLIPATAGIQNQRLKSLQSEHWIPACAGMSEGW